MSKKVTETCKDKFHDMFPLATLLLDSPPDFVLAGPPSMIGVIIFDSDALTYVTESTMIKYGYEREALNAAKKILNESGHISEIDTVSDNRFINSQLEAIQNSF